MPHTREHQHVEWKESWRDEYLKWISGFANADGGTLIIGRDDQGRAVGVRDAARLLEEIPNKVRDLLGILVDVNLRHEGGADLLEIAVEPYPYPVSYKGEYHYRSGSTKQELKGAALDRFLLRKLGRTWDGVPVPQVAVAALSPRKAAGSTRPRWANRPKCWSRSSTSPKAITSSARRCCCSMPRRSAGSSAPR